MLYFQGVSPVLCSSLMYFPLFLPLWVKARETLCLKCQAAFSVGNKLSAFESEIHLLNKFAALRARGILLLCMAHCPPERAFETGSGSCRSKADSKSHARNPLTETADRRRKTAAMVLPIHGGIHIEIRFPVSL